MARTVSTDSYWFRPPTRQSAIASSSQLGIPNCRPLNPFYSNKADMLTDRQKDHKQTAVFADLPPFNGAQDSLETMQAVTISCVFGLVPRVGAGMAPDSQADPRRRLGLQTVRRPPSRRQIVDWFRMRAALRLHTGTLNYGSASEITSEENREKKEHQQVIKGRQRRQVFVVKHDEDSDGSEMSCSSLSSCEDSPPTEQSSAARTRPLDLSSPVFSKGRTAVVQSQPLRSIMRRRSGESEMDWCTSPALTQGKSYRDDDDVPVLRNDETDQQPGKLNRRRISWHLPGQSADSNQDSSLVHNGRSGEEFSESLVRRVKDSQERRRFLTPETSFFSRSQIESPGTTPRPLLDLQRPARVKHLDHLGLLCLELHIATRQNLRPDPDHDRIEAAFYSLVRQDATVSGCIAVSPDGRNLLHRSGVTQLACRSVTTEYLLIRNLVRLIRDSDPDILAGYEVQMLSWGYAFQRAAVLGLNLPPLISRVPGSIKESRMATDEENPGAQYHEAHTSEINLVGRLVFNTWRMMRSELALYSYTLESVANKVLGKRLACYSMEALSRWWEQDRTRHRVLRYYTTRLQTQLDILARLDIISRTSELARVFGIQFYEVISRGSQFRVESCMLRLAKPRNFVPVSPTRQQLAAQAAPEYLALILEPESRMYTDPVLVLDFQSLYPSIIIGYNYCYSTCLGRIQNLGSPGPYIFGCTQLKISPNRLSALRDHINVSPGGVVFLKSSLQRGILPQMLEEILNTRIMVKQSMKKHAKDPDLQKILHSRQLGLKLIANVTYGYTSANFSGRMPCIEVGDSVVAKGRETLERAIKTIEERKEWGARVVYGDTDSVFVLLKGKTKEEAFDIGEEIAEVITKQNPKPIKLKFEKVYLPCILQTKKRYVGYMYETRDQLKPEYDAKGIETVRRDGIPATAKILEKTLRLLFEKRDLSMVRSYVQNQFAKITAGTISIQEMTFAKEFRGMSGYRPTACVPALELTRQAVRVDRRAIPRTGERVPYVVVYGEPGLPLIQLVRNPWEVLRNPDLRLNAHYYITKVIVPPLNRCFLLVGVDCATWYTDLPRPARALQSTLLNKRGVISQYFACQTCAACRQFSVSPVCESCVSRPAYATLLLSARVAAVERAMQDTCRACVDCAGAEGRQCISLDCPLLYRRNTAASAGAELPALYRLLDMLSIS